MQDGTALPPNAFPAGSQEFIAYARCIQLEDRASGLQSDGPSPLVCARILGYMLQYAPTQHGLVNIAVAVNDCPGDSELMRLADFYSNTFINCFKRDEGRTHPSQPSTDNVKEALHRVSRKPPEDHEAAKLLALERDGFRCAITGDVDYKSYGSGAVGVKEGDRPAATRAAHIIEPLTNKKISEGSDKHEYSKTVQTIMRLFGGVKVEEELNENQLHRLENIITMGASIHSFFNDLHIWLEPVVNGQPNTYQVKGIYPLILVGTLPQVTFHSDDPILLPPDPRYIALHAACAKVAHMSGASEYIEMVTRDVEKTVVLAEDGSSARVLARALQLCVDTA